MRAVDLVVGDDHAVGPLDVHRGFKVTLLSDATAAMDVKGPDGVLIPHDQVHRTHLGSLNGFLAEVKRSDEVIGT